MSPRNGLHSRNNLQRLLAGHYTPNESINDIIKSTGRENMVNLLDV